MAPFKMKGDTFGQFVITNVGTLGFTSAAAPMCPPLQAISFICLGKIEKRPIVDAETGEITTANISSAIATCDHRYGDAALLIPFFSAIRGYIADPGNFNPDDPKYKDVPHYKEQGNKKTN